MIERLRAALHTLGSLRPDEPSAAQSALVAECADALRLQLDCMQAELTPAQRDALHALDDALADGRVPPATVAAAARRASQALGEDVV